MRDNYKPKPLSSINIDWENLVYLIGETRDRIAKFDGLVRGMPSQNDLLFPVLVCEAMSSSKIEGIETTFSNVLKERTRRSKQEGNQPERLVLNYQKALKYAAKQIDENQPLAGRLIKDLQHILLKDSRADSRIIGDYRRHNVHIGRSRNIEEATYIPPDHRQVADLMSELEQYIHQEDQEVVVQLAILHAQFEIIHPFNDGNGRVGRMLMPLFLYYKKVISTPALYVSAYFESHRDRYYLKLRNITQKNEWNQWIKYCLEGVKYQAESNIKQVGQILDLYQHNKEVFVKVVNSKQFLVILDYLFQNPICSIPEFARTNNIGLGVAKSWFRKLLKADIIQVLEAGRGNRPTIYVFPELMNIIINRRIAL